MNRLPGHSLEFEADGPHECEGIAFFDDALSQRIVETHDASFEVVLEMDVVELAVTVADDFRECQIMCCDDAKGTLCDQSLDHGFRSDAPIMRVRAV